MDDAQRKAIEGYVDSVLMPLIRGVLVKKLGQSAEFMASELSEHELGDEQ